MGSKKRLPQMAGGSASALSLSRPAQALLTLRPTRSLSHPRRPLSRGSSLASYPAKPLVSYQINRQLSGWNSSTSDSRLRGARPTSDICTAAKIALFDHLVGEGEEQWGHSQPDRLGRFEVDDQLELGDLLHRQIGRLLAHEDAARVVSDQLPLQIAYRGRGSVSGLCLPIFVSRSFCSASGGLWPDSADLSAAANRPLSGVHRPWCQL